MAAKAATGFYVILGCAIRGLHDLGESPQDIMLGAEMALEQSMSEDPVLVEAGRVFVATMADRFKDKVSGNG